MSINLLIIKNGVSSVACSVGFASCKTFGKQPKHPCFGAKPPTGTRGGSPSNIVPSRGEGVWGFGKDAEIERPKALSMADEAVTQSPESVLIGIENLLYFS